MAECHNIVRIFPHFYNTLEEIDTLLDALEDLKKPVHAEQ